MLEKNASKLLLASLCAQGLALLALPLLTRHYSAASFGQLSIYSSVITILGLAATLRFEMAIPIAPSKAVAQQALALGIFCVLAIALTTLLITPLLTSNRVYWLLPLSIFFAGSNLLLTNWLIRSGKFGAMATVQFLQPCLMAFLPLLFYYAKLRSGLIIGQVFGYAAGNLLLFYFVLKNIGTFTQIDRATLYNTFQRYCRFPKLSLPASLLNNLAIYLIPILLALAYDTTIAGYYALAALAIRTPLALASNAIGQAYTHQAATLVRNKSNTLTRFYLLTVLKTLLLAMLGMTLLKLFGDPFYRLFFGSKWIAVEKFASVLAWLFMIEFIVVGPSQNFSLLQRQGLALIWNSLFLLSILTCFIAALLHKISAIHLIMLIALAGSVCYLLFFLLNLASVKKHTARAVDQLCVE